MSSNVTKFVAVGLDPSLSNFGAAKLELSFNDDLKIVGHKLLDLGLSQTSPDKKKTRRKNEEDRGRAVEHYNFLKSFLQNTDFVFCELPVGSQSARAMASYGICVGITASIELPFFVVSPHDVKLAACKNKQASKADMVAWGLHKFPHGNWLKSSSQAALTKNEHIADALASIVAGVKTEQFKQALLFMSRRK